MPPAEQIGIRLRIGAAANGLRRRDALGQMARTFEELIAWLGRDNSFPHGVLLLTGTGIVPPDDFTLAAGEWCASRSLALAS